MPTVVLHRTTVRRFRFGIIPCALQGMRQAYILAQKQAARPANTGMDRVSGIPDSPVWRRSGELPNMGEGACQACRVNEPCLRANCRSPYQIAAVAKHGHHLHAMLAIGINRLGEFNGDHLPGREFKPRFKPDLTVGRQANRTIGRWLYPLAAT